MSDAAVGSEVRRRISASELPVAANSGVPPSGVACVPAPVIAIGSSAGGVFALQQLIAAVPDDFTGCLLIVNHLSPVRDSRLRDILSRETALKVDLASDGDRVLPGQIYVAPPDRHLMLEGCGIRVTSAPRESRQRPSIDVLFRSCSIALGTRAVGVVLTGSLDDGTAGLWMIKDCGGTTIVQNPDEAPHCSMPVSALRHVDIDHVARLAEMPALFARVIAQNSARCRPATSPGIDEPGNRAWAVRNQVTDVDSPRVVQRGR